MEHKWKKKFKEREREKERLKLEIVCNLKFAFKNRLSHFNQNWISLTVTGLMARECLLISDSCIIWLKFIGQIYNNIME